MVHSNPVRIVDSSVVRGPQTRVREAVSNSNLGHTHFMQVDGRNGSSAAVLHATFDASTKCVTLGSVSDDRWTVHQLFSSFNDSTPNMLMLAATQVCEHVEAVCVEPTVLGVGVMRSDVTELHSLRGRLVTVSYITRQVSEDEERNSIGVRNLELIFDPNEEQALRILSQQAVSTSWWIDAASCSILTWSPSVSNVFGVPPQDWVGKSLFDVVHSGSTQNTEFLIAAQTVQPRSCDMPTTDGTSVIRLFILKHRNGTMMLCMASTLNSTPVPARVADESMFRSASPVSGQSVATSAASSRESHTFHNELSSHSAMPDEFTHGDMISFLGHEIGNPLQALTGNVEELKAISQDALAKGPNELSTQVMTLAGDMETMLQAIDSCVKELQQVGYPSSDTTMRVNNPFRLIRDAVQAHKNARKASGTQYLDECNISNIKSVPACLILGQRSTFTLLVMHLLQCASNMEKPFTVTGSVFPKHQEAGERGNVPSSAFQSLTAASDQVSGFASTHIIRICAEFGLPTVSESDASDTAQPSNFDDVVHLPFNVDHGMSGGTGARRVPYFVLKRLVRYMHAQIQLRSHQIIVDIPVQTVAPRVDRSKRLPIPGNRRAKGGRLPPLPELSFGANAHGSNPRTTSDSGLLRGPVRNSMIGAVLQTDESEHASFQAELSVAPMATLSAQRCPSQLMFSGTVLIVDDSPIIVNMLKKQIERFGARASTAPNGQVAVENFCSRTSPLYDLVLMDLQMPVMSGQEAIRAIRKHETAQGWNQCPIVVISGNNEGAIPGANDSYLKPIRTATVKTLMCRFLVSAATPSISGTMDSRPRTAVDHGKEHPPPHAGEAEAAMLPKSST